MKKENNKITKNERVSLIIAIVLSSFSLFSILSFATFSFTWMFVLEDHGPWMFFIIMVYTDLLMGIFIIPVISAIVISSICLKKNSISKRNFVAIWLLLFATIIPGILLIIEKYRVREGKLKNKENIVNTSESN